MLQFFLIGVVELFLFDDFLLYFFFLLSAIVILDHHHALAFIMPGGLGVFLRIGMFGANEEGLLQGAVDHHNEALHSKEPGVICFAKVK
jgi:hypothetical protein